MQTLIRTLELEYDTIEVHHNKTLTKKPYLVRVFSYNNSSPQELRLEENELQDLYEILKEHSLL